MEEKCLRNMSCRCRMCAGEDLSELLSLTRSIKSTINYADEEGGGGGGGAGGDTASPPPAPAMGRMTNSPPLPAARKTMVTNSPPVPAARNVAMAPPPPPPQQRPPPQTAQAEPMEVEVVDYEMEDTAPPPAPVMPAFTAPPPAPVSQPQPMAMEVSVSVPAMAPPARFARPPPAAAAAPVVVEAPMEMAGGGDAGGSSGDVPPVEAVLAKLGDKNWKIRKEGFEEVKAWCEQPGVRTDTVAPFLDFFNKMCEDVNASAMEAGIQAVLAYTQRVEPFQKQIVPGVMKRVVDKGFASRPGIVKLCDELVMAFVEAGAAEDTFEALIAGTKNKKPKVPPACATNMFECLKAFGPRVVPLQALKAALPTLCESTVNGVRPVALNTLAEIHRWAGPGLVQDIVTNLRQAQQTEYETLTKDVTPGQATPTKFVRGAKRPAGPATGRASGAATGTGPTQAAPAAFDPREFAETVNLLEKLPKTEFRAKLGSPKWSEKVEALKIVLELIGPVPKLANGDYGELVNTLKILCNDANVNINAKAIEVLGALSDGLRKSFTPYARLMFPELIRRLSDKKSLILNNVNNTIDLFLMHSMSIDMMWEDLKLAMDPSKSKSPQARVQALGFLARCVEKQTVNVGDRNLVMEFANAFSGGMDDSDPTVRKAGVEGFTKIYGATPQTSQMLQNMLDDISRKNPRTFKAIQQGLGGEVSVSSRPSSASSTSSARGPGSVRKPEPEDMDTSGPPAPAPPPAAPRPGGIPKRPVRGAPSRLAAKAGAPGAAAKAAATKKPGASGTGGGGAAASGDGDFTKYAVAVEPADAEGILAELNMDSWSEVVSGFSSAKWTERKTAIEHLETYAKENSPAMSAHMIEAFTVYLAKQVKDFKDSNINVLKSAFEAVGTFAENAAGKFPRGVVCMVVPAAVDKIGDRKAADAIRTMMLQLCEATSPAYVIGCMFDHMPNVKAPTAHAEVLNVLAECVKDFGVTVCNPRGLVDFSKGAQALESSNPKVRAGAIALLATMYSQLGPALLPILNLESWKPALASTVEAEFAKVGFDPSSAMASVKRQVKGDDDEDGGKKKKNDGGALFGRVDISNQITKELMADMKCEDDKAAWKKRLAAMDSVQSICEGAACAIEFTKPVAELMRALKARLSDSNANLKVKAAQVIGIVATSIGPEVAKLSKILGASLISGVSDNKKNMQMAAVEALHRWVRHNNKTSSACMESMLSPLSEGLLNPVGRAELLGWAAEHLKNCDRLDLSGLVVPTIQSMMDKSSEARDKASLVLVEVLKSSSLDHVLSVGCRDVKPAQMRTLKPLIQKAHEMAAASAAVPAAPATAPPQLPPTAATDAPVMPEVPASTSAIAPPSRLTRMGRANSTPTKMTGSRIGMARATGSFRGELPVTQEAAPAVPQESSPVMMLRMNNNKSARLAKGQYSRWIFDSTNVAEMNARKSEIEAEWRPFLSPEFSAMLFAPSLEKGMLSAIDTLPSLIVQQAQELVAALDLLLEWSTLRIVDNNVTALSRMLDVLLSLFEMLKANGYQLDDVEAGIFLPYLLQESGHPKPRFRVRFRSIMRLVIDVYSPEKFVPYLVECMNTSKNTRSRCECIDTVGHIVETRGYLVVGKKCVKEIGKFVVAHEKELRESAITTLVAVYQRTDGNLDKFFRGSGVTSQQGMDLISARIKHLPPRSVQDESTIQSQQMMNSSFNQPQQQHMNAFAQQPQQPMNVFAQQVQQQESLPEPMTMSVTPAKAPLMPPSGPPSARRFGSGNHGHFGSRVPHEDEDVVMASPAKENEYPVENMSDAIEEFLIRPVEQLVTESREIVSEASPAYVEGRDAIKALYALSSRPSDESERQWIRANINDILDKLCECLFASFSTRDEKKPLHLPILSLALSTMNSLLKSDAADNVQRYVVERMLLELCSKLQSPRFEEFQSLVSSPSFDISTFPIEKKGMFMLFKALYGVMDLAVKRAKPGEVYPAVINVLQRIVRNDVGDYNHRDSYNHLMKRDSLDQLIGRLLLKISTEQASAVMNPFEGIDIFGVLMQMHSFFSTLPHNDMFAVQIANENMQQALKIIADSLMRSRRSSFEASLQDLPMTSPVRELLSNMGYNTQVQAQASSSAALGSSFAGSSRLSGSGGFGFGSSNSFSSSGASQSHQNRGSAPQSNDDDVDNVQRRLFDDAGPSAFENSSAGSTSRYSSGSLQYRMSSYSNSLESRSASLRSTFTSSTDHSTSQSTDSTANGTKENLMALRERLERFRGY
ncbi:TPA: hypothetical protein N0F65_007526 [Lagenidium giganteum]|uniref:TOG domain-containing protein n=1 Tax=Lagenidium giganteum TaxID=4803 RepID=A0AAV2ZJ21_9STRA|nr:TPA: hypothetical protein N0F65_007526 [Lagenidium giganteum]